jgi:hypothetical protein
VDFAYSSIHLTVEVFGFTGAVEPRSIANIRLVISPLIVYSSVPSPSPLIILVFCLCILSLNSRLLSYSFAPRIYVLF